MCDYASYRAPEGREEVEPEEEDPLKKWKAHPVKKRDEKKLTGTEFLEDYAR